MDGIALLRRFQKIPALQMPSAILLTALTDLQQRLVGLEAGAIDYVAKPFEAEELLARVASQLALRRRALETARNENLTSLGTMVKGLMHEIRNPANGVVHSVKLLRELLPEGAISKGTPVDELLEVAEVCAGQLESLCVDLLGTNGRGDPIRRVVPMASVIDRARALVSGFLVNVNFQYEAHYDGDVFCSEPLIAQVLANLIKNAAHAAKTGGWVRVVSRAADGQLVLEVFDSGPGVPPELRERIFDMFFTTKGPGEGSGLGLPMSRQIIERHGGVLEVREAPVGTLFQVRIPLAEREQASTRARA
jgi:signal transduction histidine kinase